VVLGSAVHVYGAISPGVSASVSLNYTRPNLSWFVRNVTSLSNGSYSDLYVPDMAGTWSVAASWPGNAEYYGNSSLPVFFNVTLPPPAPLWNVNLTASLQGYSDTSTLGVHPNATDGFDQTLDAVDPPQPPTGVISYFWYPNNPASPVDLRKLSVSYIAPGESLNWSYRVKAVGLSGNMTISWNSSAINASVPSQFFVRLYDASGLTLLADMRSIGNYSFACAEDTVYTFMVRVMTKAECTLRLKAGWNMVSLCVTPDNPGWSSILAGVGFYQALTWVNGSYVNAVNATVGKGYWVLVLADVNVTVTGVPVYSYTLNLTAGWHMAGSVYGTVDFSNPNDNPDGSVWNHLYGWSGSAYVATQTVRPCEGYWTLAWSNCTLTVGP
jgi:hypothetical protein